MLKSAGRAWLELICFQVAHISVGGWHFEISMQLESSEFEVCTYVRMYVVTDSSGWYCRSFYVPLFVDLI